MNKLPTSIKPHGNGAHARSTVHEQRSATPDPADLLQHAQQYKKSLHDAGEFLAEQIRRSPALSIGVAIGCGVVLGWLVKRR